MRAIILTGLLAQLALLLACAAHPDPIIDTKGVDPDLLADDWQECEAYTEEVSVARGTAKGAGLGAAIGAVAGSVDGRGDVAEDAAYGAHGFGPGGRS